MRHLILSYALDEEQVSLAIRALELVDQLGLWEGEDVPIREAADSNPDYTHHLIGRHVQVFSMNGNRTITLQWHGWEQELPEFIRELIAAHDFLEKSRKHWEITNERP